MYTKVQGKTKMGPAWAMHVRVASRGHVTWCCSSDVTPYYRMLLVGIVIVYLAEHSERFRRSMARYVVMANVGGGIDGFDRRELLGFFKPYMKWPCQVFYSLSLSVSMRFGSAQ
jgi:hypothetical protein